MDKGIDVSISVSRRGVWRITLWLLAAVVLLLVLHIIAVTAPRDMTILSLRYLLDNFDLGPENTVPTWFSSSLMLAAAILMLGIGERERRRGAPLARRWILIGVIFVLMSIDETASVHELTVHPVRDRLDIGGVLGGIFYWAWVVPALVFLAFLALIYIPFLYALPQRTRWGLLIAALVYVTGAVGMEMVGGAIASEKDPTLITVLTISYTIEETLELLGMVILLHTLMMHAFVRQPARETSAAVDTSGA